MCIHSLDYDFILPLSVLMEWGNFSLELYETDKVEWNVIKFVNWSIPYANVYLLYGPLEINDPVERQKNLIIPFETNESECKFGFTRKCNMPRGTTSNIVGYRLAFWKLIRIESMCQDWETNPKLNPYQPIYTTSTHRVYFYFELLLLEYKHELPPYKEDCFVSPSKSFCTAWSPSSSSCCHKDIQKFWYAFN